MATPDRPLSPHLQVYKPQLTSVLSILHRMTGVLLCCAIPFLLYWIGSVAAGPDSFADALGFFGSLFGRLLLFAFSYSLIYHLFNGIRHLVWDTGVGLNIEAVYLSGWWVVASSAAVTIFVWMAAYAVRGGA